MTGISKDELMQMAQEYGLSAGRRCVEFDTNDLKDFYNAVLERAAEECEDRIGVMSMFLTMEACKAHNSTIEKCADSIRALKINTGD